MAYQTEAFREYFISTVGAKESSYYTYNSYLQRIDKALHGLDEALKRDGSEKVLEWARTTEESPFDAYPSHAKSVLKRYVQFLIDAETPTPPEQTGVEDTDDELEPTGLAFKLEREMQAGVRRQLANLEPGLLEADGGTERRVATGSIDIVAKDNVGCLVAIELKAGQCPAGAMEQVLGYAEALSNEENGAPVRAILIASDFPDRIRAAAKRVRDLKLVTYEFSLKFKELK
jgi:hypothetical protein